MRSKHLNYLFVVVVLTLKSSLIHAPNFEQRRAINPQLNTGNINLNFSFVNYINKEKET